MATAKNIPIVSGGGFRWRWVWLALLGLAALWLLWRVRAALTPFFLAAAAAYLLHPLVDRMEKRGLSRGRAVLLLILGMLLVGIALGATLIPLLWREAGLLQQDYQPFADKAQSLYQDWVDIAEKTFQRVRPGRQLSPLVEAKAGEYLQWALARLPALLGRVLGALASFGILVLLTLILTYWMLKEYRPLLRRLLAFVPARHISSAVTLSGELNHIVSAYLLGLLLLCAVAAIVAAILLFALRVQYAYLLGLLVGIGYAIPYFGVPAATIITVIVAAATGHHSWPNLLGIVGGLIGLNLVLDYALSPRIIGKSVGLHPMTVIFALLAAGELFGFVGILIALPLAGATKACLAHFFPEFFSTEDAEGFI